jgi:hypothetical protein
MSYPPPDGFFDNQWQPREFGMFPNIFLANSTFPKRWTTPSLPNLVVNTTMTVDPPERLLTHHGQALAVLLSRTPRTMPPRSTLSRLPSTTPSYAMVTFSPPKRCLTHRGQASTAFLSPTMPPPCTMSSLPSATSCQTITFLNIDRKAHHARHTPSLINNTIISVYPSKGWPHHVSHRISGRTLMLPQRPWLSIQLLSRRGSEQGTVSLSFYFYFG